MATNVQGCRLHSSVDTEMCYPLVIHFKCMVDLVVRLMGVGQMKYLVLARENLMNQVEGRPLETRLWWQCASSIIGQYGCVGKFVVDMGELNANEARELFDNLGIKLPLTTTYKAKEIGNQKEDQTHRQGDCQSSCKKSWRWFRLLCYA